ncbi:MAG: HAD-IIB family hydrolase [Gammaproteobacteria bacterium]|nr:HAD-IIB family hydrolase [Gammaproteobacteria bacterium]
MSRHLLLCTDLDRTVIPNGAEPESSAAREKFKALAQHSQVTLVYVTGRHLALIEEAITLYNLPTPDFIIGDVGSSIYQRADHRWSIWQNWHDKISADWSGHGSDNIKELLRNTGELRLQEQSKQNRYKLSYYFPIGTDLNKLVTKVKTVLDAHNIQASLITSIDEPAAIGLLDILPAKADKLRAIEFVMSQLGIPHEQTIFAGDSGNDLPVLVSPINAVVVANAPVDICRQAQQQASLMGNEENLYCAKGGYLDMNGNYSAGVIEGVVHYMPEAEEWLR